MRTPITYYGGKQTLAPRIIELIPDHRVYVEPFLGGGAVFFRKKKSLVEVINDHDDLLINFYHQAQTNFEALKNLVENTLHSESMYNYAKDIWNDRVDAGPVEKAWSVWMITNCSFNGSMYGGWKWCNGTSGSNTAVFMENKRNSFNSELKERFKNVQISCRDALKVIVDRDSIDTIFYLDPPYPGSVQQHYYGYTMKHFIELLDLISNLKGKFILSNYWSQTLKYYILKNNWNYEKIDVNIKVRNLRNISPDRKQDSKKKD